MCVSEMGLRGEQGNVILAVGVNFLSSVVLDLLLIDCFLGVGWLLA